MRSPSPSFTYIHTGEHHDGDDAICARARLYLLYAIQNLIVKLLGTLSFAFSVCLSSVRRGSLRARFDGATYI